MNVFKYKALSSEGLERSGVVLADNLSQAYADICRKQLMPTDISRVYRVSSKISLNEILMFFLHIDFQLKCGTKINDAIENYTDFQGNKILNAKLLEISESLKSGYSLKEAFQNSVFDTITTGLLEAAEKTGNLSEIISNILEFLKLQKEWKSKVKSTLAYPIFMACLALCIMWFCAAILGPQVIELLNDYANGDVPLLTSFTVNYLPRVSAGILGIMIISVVLFIKGSKKSKNKLLTIPVLGDIFCKAILWKFFKTLQIALTSKLDFIKAFDLGLNSVSVEKIYTDLMQAKTQILCGYKIFESLSALKYLPKSIVTAIYVGETGNNLENSIARISDELYKEIGSDLKNFGQFLNVGLIGLTGGIFIFILYSLFYPLYNYVEVIGQ